MKRTNVIFAGLIFLLACDISATSIYSLIRKGRLKEAANSLSALSTAATRDGDLLYFSALIEPNGIEAMRLMEAALKSSVGPLYREDIYLRLAQFYFFEGSNKEFDRVIGKYRSLWENGRYLGEMLRYSIVADEQVGDFDAAIRQADRFSLLFSRKDVAQLGTVDKARVMLRFNKRIGADKLLRKLSREKSGPGVPLSLYMLARQALRERRTDDAVFYYNIMREGYPAAIGLEALITLMMDASTSDATDNTAEKLTGTFYSVKVGVFSNKGNAKKQAGLFKSYDRKVEIKEKRISNVKYHVVYVGRFSNYLKAIDFKDQLEANHKEFFQVVAR